MSEEPDTTPIDEQDDQQTPNEPASEFERIEVGDKEILSEVPLTAAPADLESERTETEAVKEPSRFALFLRRALIWLGAGMAVFLAGFLTMYFTLYQPKITELERTSADLTDAQSEIVSLNARLDLLEGADAHRSLLTVLVDVYDARLALTEENAVAAKSALANTPAALDEVLDEIEEFDATLAEALPQRLNLIRTNIDRDPETAIADCDQMIEDLMEVEQALFP